MPLKCRCICGCKLLVASDSAGKRIKCPKCERKLRVPVDVVEKRRAQLESRQAAAKATQQRSKIEKPLSSLVDLPEPEPPPIQTDATQPVTAPSRSHEPTKPPAVPSPTNLSRKAPVPSASPPSELPDKADTTRRPPPLPKRDGDRPIPRREPEERAELSEPVDDKLAPTTVPAVTSPVSETDPTTIDDAGKAPRLENDEIELPVRGYEADRDKVATVRWLAAAILFTGLVGTVPALIDVVEHSLSETSAGLSRWACGLFLVGLLQLAYAVYLVQLPDWSSVWVVTIFTLAIAASYAAMFGLTLLSSDQGQFVQILDLADRLRGGKATAWCVIMLSLMSLTSYFSGRVGARWRSAFIA